MPGYTKARTEEIHAAARRLVAAVGGVETLDAMKNLDARRYLFIGLAKQLANNESVTYKTARQHIVKACRRMRTPTHTQSPNWGGARDGAGRKSMNEEIKRDIERNLSDEAIAAWHNGESHPDIDALLKKYPEGFQVWGSRTGTEPLTIVYPA